ncbi:N-acetylneuraminate lyase [Sediminispirochaeta bajacaliforniensis]|uniref:N-acetylneuraminate lyase n=1 Tax=Sediminispirochaeta bajacaliforniensis TaxID=148 RepID=UPI00037682DF|nr:N-acetylneuraminate lyase [Sediminispirochaeta bajacaliforniensis]
MKKMTGIFPALLTPFSGTKINEKALRAIVEWNIKQGVSGFYVCGSTGEAFLLKPEERKQILEIVADQVGRRVSIIAHIGAIGTDLTLDLGRHAVSVAGVDAVSSIPPFYYQFSVDEVVRYYLDIAQTLSFPVIPYNFPKLSGITLTPDIVKALRKEPHIIGVKFTSNDFYGVERMKAGDSDLLIYNGLDEMYLAGLSMGVDGAIGSTFNFMADKYLSITSLFASGDMKEARRLQTEANSIIEMLLETRCFMAAQKYVLDLIGCPFGEPRAPFFPLTEAEKEMLAKRVAPLLTSMT